MFFLLSASIHFIEPWWSFDNHLSNAKVLNFNRELPGIEAIPDIVKPSLIAFSFNFLLISFFVLKSIGHFFIMYNFYKKFIFFGRN